MIFDNISGACLDENKLLPIDTACFSIINENNHFVTFYSGFDNCLICDGQPVTDLPPNSNTTIQISTKYPLRIYYYDTGAVHPYLWCVESFRFLEYGRYGWNISRGGSCSHIYTYYESLNPFFLPIAVILLYILLIVLLCNSKSVFNSIVKYINKLTKAQDDLYKLQDSNSISQVPTASKFETRIQALDAFWGITILFMIFINNGGGKYTFFNYSVWNGLTFPDLVLPWFAWAMGFTIIISLQEFEKSISNKKFILMKLRQVINLIIFGLMINSRYESSLSKLRFTGVLQLLAISYFICSIIEKYFTSLQKSFQLEKLLVLQDILERWVQWLIVFIVLLLHTFITYLIRIPGCPRGYTGPGGYHRRGDYMNCTAGSAGYIDRFIFGQHMYMEKENLVYGPILSYDPEGLMNTIASILVISMGIQAGQIFITYNNSISKIIRWKVWSFGLAILSLFLTDGTINQGVIPINKNMMSLSYMFCTCSFAFILFSTLYYAIDHKKWWSGAPFIYAGANPMLLYIGNHLTMRLFPFAWQIPGTSTHLSILIMNLWTTTLWGIIAYGLYKEEIIMNI